MELDFASKEWHTRNVWLLSFYLAGIRVADVLEMKWKNVQDGKLRYQLNKNQKVVSLMIPEKALTIFSYYEPYKVLNGGYIFSELKGVDEKDSKAVLAVIRNANKKLNKYLKRIAKLAKINKNITMHISRHTFGNISGDKISVQMLQKLYRQVQVAVAEANEMNCTYSLTFSS
ncbi:MULTISPECIES: tyrosine-type recombinase/integrase [unclassified Chryseobacterium]|uniref:tyrosine-type recombinase/integrase n=1 Tax=unclassified Chryseobacterium TaxID=2593645 RepID=UPI000D3D1758|nr:MULTISPECIES: tyrosine-type recombinase/integrase [unclassified Chryseobacterium]PTT70930.1 hypothetical protein DBR25_17665 [Chryseobacterium sp. HMWF001]PVV55232.1 hypothetical protein DD829_15325 [Chryseobacterium sp. HMWF035]